MTDLSPETRALLDRARGGEILPAAKRRTMRTRLAVALGVAAPLTLVTAFRASASVTTWVTRTLVIFGAAGAVGVGAAAFLVSPRVRAHDVETVRTAGLVPPWRQPRATLPDHALERASDLDPAGSPGNSARTEDAEASSVHSARAERVAALRVLPLERVTPVYLPAAARLGATGVLPSSRGVSGGGPELGPAVEAAPAVQAGAALPPGSSEMPASPLAPGGAPAPFQAIVPETLVRSSAAPAEDALAFEVRVLAEAHRAIEGGDAPRASSLLDEYDRRFPAGALSPESHALRVDALCAVGRTAEARAEARAFRAQHPLSPLVRRFASTCAAADGGGPATAPHP